MRRLLPLTVLLFAGLAGPASADLTLTAPGGNVTVTGTDAAETLTVTNDGADVTFAVASGTITTTDCGGSGASVTCTGATAVAVDLGGGDDTLVSPTPVTTPFRVEVNLGAGRDRLDLSKRTEGITASPSAVGGSAIRLQGLEDITATPQADFLTGNSLANHFQGGAGPDLLQGGQGDDLLEGGAGADTLRDTGGLDTLSGDAGDDQIFAADGVSEPVDCGAGTDTASVDTDDRVVGCEDHNVVSPYALPSPSPSPTATPAPTTLPAAGVLKLRRRGAKLRRRTIRTRTTATCGTRACRLRIKTRFGTRSRVLAAGQRVRVTFKLSRKSARELRRASRRKRRVRFSLRLRAAGATTVRGRVRVTVKV